MYKEHFKLNGILSQAENISLIWNTDGIPVFKSSSYSLWPLYFIINELPYKLRMCKQNSLLSGIWFGNSKLEMQMFLKPIRNTRAKFESSGVTVCINIKGIIKQITTRVFLLAGTADLPAKCAVLNFRQYNGFYGCDKCLQPGSTLSLGPRSHTYIYPFVSGNPSGPLRSHQLTIDDVKHFVTSGNTRNGVLGPSWLGTLKYYDIIRGTSIDYMHSCLLEVV